MLPCVQRTKLFCVLLQDYIIGLYHFLGLPVGAEFSAADVTLLYRKVFQLPSSTDEACAAMQKVTFIYLSGQTGKSLSKPGQITTFSGLFQAALGDKSWLCVGKNVLEVLLEMERERERQEKVAK